MEIFDLLITKFELFMIIFVRVLGLLAMLPIYGDKGLPRVLIIGIALFSSYLVFPLALELDFQLPQTLGPMALAFAGELFIGLLLGFTIKMISGAIQIAGQFIAFQMGFAIVNVVDPSGQQMSIVSKFQEMMALAIFFGLHMDHIYITSILEGFQITPPLGVHLTAASLQLIIQQSAMMFIVAVKIGAPIIVTLFAANLAMGLVARAVPQMNVFVVGFPVSIGVGLVLLGVTLPMFITLIRRVYLGLEPVVQRLVVLVS